MSDEAAFEPGDKRSKRTRLADLIGQRAVLEVVRVTGPGAFLGRADSGDDVVLLPKNEVPNSTAEGDSLDVFIHLDSDDRLIATRREPLITLDEVAFATIADVTSMGAFVEWGLVKQLFLPHAEQTQPVRVGERHPVGLLIDRSGRLAATMRITEMLRARPELEPGTWVDGEAWRKDSSIGVFVIVQKRFVALVPAHEPNSLRRGDAKSFRVANVLPDGRAELSLRPIRSEAMSSDGDHILDVLADAPSLRIGDHSSPDLIRERFSLSKKAFKRAVGGLLKDGRVHLDDEGCIRIP